MFLHFLHTLDMFMLLSDYAQVITFASLALSTLSGKWYILNKYLEIIY